MLFLQPLIKWWVPNPSVVFLGGSFCFPSLKDIFSAHVADDISSPWKKTCPGNSPKVSKALFPSVNSTFPGGDSISSQSLSRGYPDKTSHVSSRTQWQCQTEHSHIINKDTTVVRPWPPGTTLFTKIFNGTSRFKDWSCPSQDFNQWEHCKVSAEPWCMFFFPCV